MGHFQKNRGFSSIKYMFYLIYILDIAGIYGERQAAKRVRR